MKLCMVAKIAVEKATFSFDRLFDYQIPASFLNSLVPGQRVLVPFGGGNKKRQGMIFAIEEEQPEKKLKEIYSVVDEEPILSEEFLKLCIFLKQNTFCTYFDAVKLIIPAGMMITPQYVFQLNKKADLEQEFTAEQQQIIDFLRSRPTGIKDKLLYQRLGITADSLALQQLCVKNIVFKSGEYVRRLSDETIKMVRLSDSYLAGEEADGHSLKLTPKQKQVVQLLESAGAASVKEVCYFACVTANVISTLEKKGILSFFERQTYRNPYPNAAKDNTMLKNVLSPSQEEVFQGLKKVYSENKASVSLLYGITGSGKTRVFLELIQYILTQGKSVIVMVPEIALTAQTISLFHKCFGKDVAVMHSGLSMGERLDEWKRVREGKARIVIGTRSSVFAPLTNIGLIIMDEEQENTYKSEKNPRYHAREVAKFRCVQHNAMLLLASATPDIETYYKAEKGKYHLFTLKERFAGAVLPQTVLVDMNLESKNGNKSELSNVLIDEIANNMGRGEQTILLMNRRGYHTIIKCSECGHVATCPHCSIALTYHKANNSLLCHYCGYLQKVPTSCEECGSEYIRYSGAGTQKIEADLKAIFPLARILRMDMDTTMAKFSHQTYFEDFSAGKYDIMVGTQMVAKGLNFPNVTLVGVLNADKAIFSSDFRGAEKAFSLITQVVGRCGRGEKRGRAYIQSFSPDNPIIGYGCTQDYEAFYVQELANRKLLTYPPFCDICVIGFSGIFEQEVDACAKDFLTRLTQMVRQAYSNMPLKVLGPTPAMIYKMHNKYRVKLLLKCHNNAKFRLLIQKLLEDFCGQYKKVTVFADMNGDLNL